MHHTGAKLRSAAQQLCAPSLGNRALVASLKAVYERGSNCGALLGREPKNVFKNVVNSGIHEGKHSIQRPATSAA